MSSQRTSPTATPSTVAAATAAAAKALEGTEILRTTALWEHQSQQQHPSQQF